MNLHEFLIVETLEFGNNGKASKIKLIFQTLEEI